MPRIEITFIYEADVDNLSQQEAERLAENFIIQIVLGGEDVKQYFNIKILEEEV